MSGVFAAQSSVVPPALRTDHRLRRVSLVLLCCLLTRVEPNYATSIGHRQLPATPFSTTPCYDGSDPCRTESEEDLEDACRTVCECSVKSLTSATITVRCTIADSLIQVPSRFGFPGRARQQQYQRPGEQSELQSNSPFIAANNDGDDASINVTEM